MHPERHAMARGGQGDVLVCAGLGMVRQVLACELTVFTCFCLDTPAGRSFDLNDWWNRTLGT